MADRLLAINGNAYLSPATVVNRLKAAFSYIETDGEEGRRYILAVLARLQSDASQQSDARQMAEKLDRLKDRTVFVCFGDNAGSDLELLCTYVIPEMPLVFEYASAAHENMVNPLLGRCAAALGYEIARDRRTGSDPAYKGRERRDFRNERRGFIERRSSLKERRKARLQDD